MALHTIVWEVSGLYRYLLFSSPSCYCSSLIIRLSLFTVSQSKYSRVNTFFKYCDR